MESLEDIEVPVPDPTAVVVSCSALSPEYEHVLLNHKGNFEFLEAQTVEING